MAWVFEQEIMSYIRSGQVGALAERLRRMEQLGDDVRTVFPMYRSHIVIGMTIASRAAMEGGVDYVRAMDMLDRFTSQAVDLRRNTSNLFENALLQFAKMAAAVQSGLPDDPLCAAIIRYMKNHADEKLSPHTLGNALGYSPSYLCAHFKKHTGKPISAWAHEIKIEEAKRLLLMQRYSCQEISERLSYSSQANFAAAFRRLTGAPSAWLRNNMKARRS